MSEGRLVLDLTAGRPAHPASAARRPWIFHDFLGAIARLRGVRNKEIDQPRSVAAVLDAPPTTPTSDNAARLVPLTKTRPAAKVVMVVVFDLGPAELGTIVEVVDEQSAAAGVVPIFLTDSDDFQPFRSRRVPFEYLPPPSHGARFAPDLDWELYRQRRLALLRRKWQPGRIVAFGPTASAAVAAWRESPFEDPSIAEVIAGGDGSPVGLR